MEAHPTLQCLLGKKYCFLRDVSVRLGQSQPVAHLQNGTCIVAGGSEAQNEETQALAAQAIGCKSFNRTALHMQACASTSLFLHSSANTEKRTRRWRGGTHPTPLVLGRTQFVTPLP